MDEGAAILFLFQTVAEGMENYNIKGKGDVYDYVAEYNVKTVIGLETVMGSLKEVFITEIEPMLVGQYKYSFESTGVEINDTSKFIFPTEMGRCFEINDDSHLQQTISGIKGGLTIDLDANLADYLFTTKTRGFKVFIRDQGEVLMLDQGAHVIAPGTETFMKLSAKELTRLPKPYGTCQNVESGYSRVNGTHYETVRECVERQKLTIMVQNCSCLPWYLGRRLFDLNATDKLDEAVKFVKPLFAEQLAHFNISTDEIFAEIETTATGIGKYR